MLRRPPRSTLFPTRRSSDLLLGAEIETDLLARADRNSRRKAGLQPAVLGRHRHDLRRAEILRADRKSTRLNSSHLGISYAVFCLKKKKTKNTKHQIRTIRIA